jgi:hypothetical protein
MQNKAQCRNNPLRASARTKLFHAEAAEFRRGAEIAVIEVMLSFGKRANQYCTPALFGIG